MGLGFVGVWVGDSSSVSLRSGSRFRASAGRVGFLRVVVSLHDGEGIAVGAVERDVVEGAGRVQDDGRGWERVVGTLVCLGFTAPR